MLKPTQRIILAAVAATMTNCATSPNNIADRDFFIGVPASSNCPNPGAAASVQDMLNSNMGPDVRAVAEALRCQLEQAPIK